MRDIGQGDDEVEADVQLRKTQTPRVGIGNYKSNRPKRGILAKRTTAYQFSFERMVY